jgi:muconolactone delta-isomerase
MARSAIDEAVRVLMSFATEAATQLAKGQKVDVVERLIADERAADPTLTREQAVALVMRKYPHLAEAYRRAVLQGTALAPTVPPAGNMKPTVFEKVQAEARRRSAAIIAKGVVTDEGRALAQAFKNDPAFYERYRDAVVRIGAR